MYAFQTCHKIASATPKFKLPRENIPFNVNLHEIKPIYVHVCVLTNLEILTNNDISSLN